MTKLINTIYEDGVFRPVDSESLTFSDGERVRLIVDDNSTRSADSTPDVLSLAAQVYSGLSADEVRAVERIAADRAHSEVVRYVYSRGQICHYST